MTKPPPTSAPTQAADAAALAQRFEVYLVGGAVRDAVLGLPHDDHDYVVVGATAEAMVEAGFKPVGKDFPVFLHPVTHAEYALARTERKQGRGYHGFVVYAGREVTLEQDLQRRDLTINAMARDTQGRLIDPWGGMRDLRDKVLRHVSPAFVEDPVRILRLARFAARWPDFEVAPETMALMREMVQNGEVDALVSERVWQELARGLMAHRPSRMLQVLRACGALARLLPEVERLYGVPQRADYHPEVDTGVHLELVLDMAAQLDAPLPVRFACLGHDLGKGETSVELLPRHLGHESRSRELVRSLSERLRVPTDCRELAELMASEHSNVHRSADLEAAAVLRLLERCDALRRPERFAQLLLACECDQRGRQGYAQEPYPQRPRLLQLLQLVNNVDSAQVVAQAQAAGLSGEAIGERLRQARLEALRVALQA